ncbi:MAG: AAA family ATPase [Candidatus Sungbacteria bacterium]|nr:AAA family ATPase [Candidatus Sungbacteria bacterium]
MESAETPQEPKVLPIAQVPVPVFQYHGEDYNHPIITFPGVIISVLVSSPQLKKLLKLSSLVIVSHTDLYRVTEDHGDIVIPPIPYTYGVMGIIRKKEELRKALRVEVECTYRVKMHHVEFNKIFVCQNWEILKEEAPASAVFQTSYFKERMDLIGKYLDGFTSEIDLNIVGVAGFTPRALNNTELDRNTLGIYLDQGAHLLNAYSKFERVMKFLRSYLIEPNVMYRMGLLAAFFEDIREEIDFPARPEAEGTNNSNPETNKTTKSGGNVSVRNAEYEKCRQQYQKIKPQLPLNVQEEIESALERFQKEEKSHDAKSHLVYLLKLFSLEETRDNTDIVRAKDILDQDHAGLQRPKERVLEHLAVRKYSTSNTTILCFVGPPGVGKTSLGKSIARALGRKFVRFSLGGLRDESEIKGHGFTYMHTEPGQIVKHLINGGSKNPVFLLDEIDKIGRDVRGDAAAALLELLDPEQNANFFDRSLDVPFDCSKIFFICTANTLSTVPPPLRDRMEIIKLSGYTPYEKLAIAKHHLIPKMIIKNGFPLPQGGGRPPFAISFSDNAIHSLIEKYTEESGVRQLERLLGEITRKIALRFERVEFGEQDNIHITEQNLHIYAGKPLVYPEQRFEKLPPGCVPMFAVSETGGYFFYVEIMFERGRDQRKIKVTGVRGSETSHDISNLIEESVDVAFDSLMLENGVLSRSIVEREREKEYYVHVHVGDSATPKDGPSAGIPILWALYSLFQGKPIQPNLGATGEIDLKLGVIGAVGGIREKALAAYRAGIKRFIIPEDNARDLDEIPEEIKREIEFLPKRFWWDALLEAFPDDDLILSYREAQKNS